MTVRVLLFAVVACALYALPAVAVAAVPNLPPVFLVGERGTGPSAAQVAIVPLRGSFTFVDQFGTATRFDSIYGARSVTTDQTLAVRSRSRLVAHTGIAAESVVIEGAVARQGRPLDQERTSWDLGSVPTSTAARAVTLRVRYTGGVVPYHGALCTTATSAAGSRPQGAARRGPARCAATRVTVSALAA